MIKLTDEERKQKIEQIKISISESQKRLDESPCIYSGCELWSDCRTCKGWKDGCPARVPEALYKDKEGRWIPDTPW